MIPAQRDPGRAGRFATVAVIVALFSIGAAVFEWCAAFRARAAVLAASGEYMAAQKELWAVAQRDQAKEKKLAELPQPANPEQTAGAAVGAPPPRSAGSASVADQKAEWQGLLALHPEIHDLMLTYIRRQFELTFGAFLRSAGATAAQIDQLETAMTQSFLDGLALGPQGNIHPTTGLMLPAEQQRAILGDQISQQLQDFNRAIPAQNVANQIATKAGFASAPLSSQQAAQLAQTVAANSPEYASGKNVNLGTVDWNATLAQIGAFLSPAQAQAAERQITSLQYQFALGQARQAASGPK